MRAVPGEKLNCIDENAISGETRQTACREVLVGVLDGPGESELAMVCHGGGRRQEAK
jgi:hypothetical protein